MPARVIRGPGAARPRLPVEDPPAYLPTGDLARPFDFCGHIRRLAGDVVAHCQDLAHVDVSRLLFAVTQARSCRPHGLQARVTPLRFPDGRLTRQRRGVFYQVQRYFFGRHEFLYLVTFCLPRFLDQAFHDKLVTLFHELYHISPAFDGDLRRYKGRCAVHSRSQRRYDEHMADLVKAYLAAEPDPDLHAFLRFDFRQLTSRHGGVVGVVVPRARVVPVGPGQLQAACADQNTSLGFRLR